MNTLPKHHPGAIVQRENLIFRDCDIDGLIRLADERDPAAAQHLRRLYVRTVKRGDTPDKLLIKWVAGCLQRLEWQGVRVEVAFGIKPGSRPPVDSQGRYDKLVQANDLVRRVEALRAVCASTTECFEQVASELNRSVKSVQGDYYAYRVPENTSQE